MEPSSGAGGGDSFARSLHRDFWLPNGMGGWCATSELGINTRKYHALLAASVAENPSRVHLLLSKFEDLVLAGDFRFDLSSSVYPGKVYPGGHKLISRFECDGASAAWHYALLGEDEKVEIVKEVWPSRHKNTTFTRYTLASELPHLSSVWIEAAPLVLCRPAHSIGTVQDVLFNASSEACEFTSPIRWYISIDSGTFVQKPLTYYNVLYPLEQERGEAYQENHFSPGYFRSKLTPGASITICASLSGPESFYDGIGPISDLGLLRKRNTRLLSEYYSYNRLPPIPQLEHLVVSAGHFVVRYEGGHAIVAGYPYFGIWGRDTFLSLPGIAIYTGRHGLARSIISSMLSREQRGLLPNHIDGDGQPVYSSADASLWAIWAIWHLDSEGGIRNEDRMQWWPRLRSIALNYMKGNSLVSCNSDCLLSLASDRSTWMDAAIDGNAATPRAGLRVEINALWAFSLQYLSEFAEAVGDEQFSSTLGEAHTSASGALQEFFNQYAGYFDDGIKPTDGSMRPNQIWALALPHLHISPQHAKQALSAVREHLLTPYGLRTLSPQDKNYHEHYRGNQRERDSAYHQGAAWPYLLGAYTDAVLLHQPERAQDALRIVQQLLSESHGAHNTLAEVYDPANLTPAGCPSQAWSVAEALRSATMLYRQKYTHGRLPSMLAAKH